MIVARKGSGRCHINTFPSVSVQAALDHRSIAFEFDREAEVKKNKKK